MRISDIARLGGRPGRATAVLLLFASLASLVMVKEGQPFGTQFYSFVPAQVDGGGAASPSASLWGDDMQKAKKAYRDGDYPAARVHLEAALANGNVSAAWYLGHLWRLGLGGPADSGKAFHYYGQVALGYDPMEPRPGALDISVDALVRLGDYYLKGDPSAGVVQDFNRAYRLYSAAAGHGHPSAQFSLGTMYLDGKGVRANTGRALRWLMLAARKRHWPAEALLGDLYWEGKLVAEDRARAIMWYMLASQTARTQSHPDIQARLRDMLSQASEEERLRGQKDAELWADRFQDEQADLATSAGD